jgi:transmembrane sensor
MSQEPEHIEVLIGKFLVGEASAEETRELEEWTAASPENQKYIEDARWVFENAQLSDGPAFDADLAWEKVAGDVKPHKKTIPLFPLFWKFAAGLVLLLGLSYLFYKQMPKRQEFLFLSENEVLTEILPDLTEVSLNQQSEIRVDYHPGKKTGTIYLTGEALISIPEDKKVTWIVQAAGVLIEDIGTVFHVQAYPDQPLVEVSVKEGIVRFYAENREGIILESGEQGTYDPATKAFSKTIADANVAAFKTRVLDFQEEELQQVAKRLESVYGKRIVLDGEIASCRLTVFFDNETLETVLLIIAETLGIEVLDEGNLIRLRGDGCQ